MTVIHLGNQQYLGTSSDTKPTNVPVDAVFYEKNTRIFYYADGSGGWNERSTVLENDYTVYLAGSVLKAKNGSTGMVDYKDSTATPDIGAMINTIIGVLTSGGLIKVKSGNYTINTPFALQKGTATQIVPIWMEGELLGVSRQFGSILKIGSSFPTGRYVWESVSAGGSGTTSQFSVQRFGIHNVSFARSGTTGSNINGPGTVIDAGVLKFESDSNSGSTAASCIVKDIYHQYMWRGIHVLGYTYYPIFENIQAIDNNANFVGDFDFKFESGVGHADYVKVAEVHNLKSGHIAGQGIGTGTGSMNAAMVFSGGYHNISNLYVDGMVYNDCVFGMKQIFSSALTKPIAIDLADNSRATVPASFKGVLLLDTVEPGGVAPINAAYSTYNNQIWELGASPNPYSIYFLNSPYRNDIRTYAYYGSPITINDAAAGIGNNIYLINGQQLSTTANTKITSTNNIVKIIDTRVGANNKGFSSQTGNGSQTAFTIAHGLFGTPVNYYVYPVTSAASGGNVTVDGTNITITFGVAPYNTASLKWSWYADLYPQ